MQVHYDETLTGNAVMCGAKKPKLFTKDKGVVTCAWCQHKLNNPKWTAKNRWFV